MSLLGKRLDPAGSVLDPPCARLSPADAVLVSLLTLRSRRTDPALLPTSRSRPGPAAATPADSGAAAVTGDIGPARADACPHDRQNRLPNDAGSPPDGRRPSGHRNQRRTGRCPPGTHHTMDTSPLILYTSARPTRPPHRPGWRPACRPVIPAQNQVICARLRARPIRSSTRPYSALFRCRDNTD
jgi:hypothetical protein